MPLETFQGSRLPKILKQYCGYQKDIQGVQDSTVYQRLLHVKPFTVALRELAAPSRIHEVEPHFIHRYILKKSAPLTRKYQKELLCALRSFFKFLAFYGHTDFRLIDAVPKLPTWQLSDVPRGIPWADVQKLLRMPRRNTSRGKRNYAVLLLIATYGVRCAQGVRLKLGDIHWREEVIHFAPCKGGRPLNLPLYPQVAEALLDYIKNGRPKSDLQEIFLQERGPIQPLRPVGIHTTLKWYYNRAGIQRSKGFGFHAIRHAFATKLMNEETPVKTISDLLGHRSINSTLCYTKVNETGLRRLCQEWPEVAQ